MSEHIDSFYSRTLHDDIRFPVQTGRIEVETCIVGGGLAGLTTALELTRRGLSVALLDSWRIGWGASGRNGGFVTPGYSTGLDNVMRLAGATTGKEVYRLSIEGMEMVRQTIAALRLEQAADPQPGILRAVRYEPGDALLRHRERMIRDFDYPLRHLGQAEMRDALDTPAYRQGLMDERAFHFHPLNYAQGLARAIVAGGGLIFEDSPAIALGRQGAGHLVRTTGGQIAARNVVIACGGYTDHLRPKLRHSHLPIATYVLLTEAAPDLVASAIRTRAGVGDDRRASDYYRRVDGGNRILWGGRITTRVSEPSDLAQLLRQSMIATFPQLAPLRIEAAWSGLMSYARHLMPMIGQMETGLFYLMGFGGHGMNTTSIGGRVVAEAIAGDSDRIRLFEPFGLVWNGGPVGVAAVQATYWMYRAQDTWRERNYRTL
jgi:glycine/D-amino acid oxidase-like deaminating enzyme